MCYGITAWRLGISICLGVCVCKYPSERPSE